MRVYFHAHIKLDHRISVSAEVKLRDLHILHVVLMHLYDLSTLKCLCVIQKENLTLPRLTVRIITLLMHSICLHTKRSGRCNQPIGNLSN